LDESLQPANLARLMSVLLRQLTMQNENSIFIWTNQWRDKISKLPLPPSTPGGRALGFYASTRLELREAEKETVEIDTVSRGTVAKRKSVTGRWVNVTVRKEKTGARPESSGSFLLDYERKVPLVSQELIDLGMQDGLIERHGNIYTVVGYDGKVTANGIKQMRTKIEKDEKLEDWLRTCVEERTAELDEGDG
jgi:RecA/RadA recombinase